MKLKSNLKKWQAQITFEPVEAEILKNVLEKVQFQLPYLEMTTTSELIDKFSTFIKAIEKDWQNYEK